MFSSKRFSKTLTRAMICMAPIVFIQAFVMSAHAATFPIRVNDVALTVEIAQTPTDQRKGLQHRTHLPPDHGMLFVFLNPRAVCMWMRDVPIDLDVGFFDDKMRLVKIATMKRQTDTHHCADRPVAYALEVNRDWFKRHNIKPGALLKLE